MDWRFSTFLLVLCTLLFVFTWGTPEAAFCHYKYIDAVLSETGKDGALNCFDFWFNRYQTLIAALVALAAAVIGTRIAHRQLDEAKKQVEAALAQVSLSEQQSKAAMLQASMTSYEFWSQKRAELRELERLHQLIFMERPKLVGILARRGVPPIDDQSLQAFEVCTSTLAEFESRYSKYRWLTAKRPLFHALMHSYLHHISMLLKRVDAHEHQIDARLGSAALYSREMFKIEDGLVFFYEVALIDGKLDSIEREMDPRSDYK